MTLLFMDGFEMGDFASRYVVVGTPALSTSTRFNAGRCITYSSSTPSLTRGFAAMNRCIVGGACFFAQGSDTANVIQFFGDAGTTNHVTINVTSSGAITARRGTGSGTILATSSVLVPMNTWVYLEASATISDTVGVVKVRLNGVEVINFTGDTKNAGTNTTIDAVAWSLYASSLANRWDDIYVCDDTGAAPYNDFLGDVRVVTLAPTGPGASTGLTPSVAPNWGAVDEQPYSATDYVSSTVAGAKDTYAMGDLPAGAASVLAVQNVAIAKKTDAGARSLKNVVRSGGTDYADAAAQALPTADGVLLTLRTANPNGGAAWTVAAVNALEAGVEVA